MAKPPPPVGTVQDGYRYNGGDPSMKSSWSWVDPATTSHGGSPQGLNADAPGAAFFSGAGGAPKLSANDQKDLQTQRQAARDAQSMRADARRFSELNKQAGTGGIAGPLGGALALVNPTYAEMKAITDRITPLQRTAGSGAMSDRDVEMYRSSTIGLGKPGPANGALVRVIEAGAKRQSDYSAFLEEWAKRTGSVVGAQEAWQAYAEANPLFAPGKGNTAVQKVTPWKEWFGLAPAARQASGATAKPLTPAQIVSLGAFMVGSQPDRPSGGAAAQKPKVRRYNPATGKIE